MQRKGSLFLSVLQGQVLFLLDFFTNQRQQKQQKMGEERAKVPVVEETSVRVLCLSEASYEPDDKSDYPSAGTNSIYSAILSRNEAVKDAKRLKTFLELRDKYVKKEVIFEDPLFPANDSSLFYSHKPPMKIEWKRPSVSVPPIPRSPGNPTHPSMLHLMQKCLSSARVCVCVSHYFHKRGAKLILLHVWMRSSGLSPSTVADS